MFICWKRSLKQNDFVGIFKVKVSNLVITRWNIYLCVIVFVYVIPNFTNWKMNGSLSVKVIFWSSGKSYSKGLFRKLSFLYSSSWFPLWIIFQLVMVKYPVMCFDFIVNISVLAHQSNLLVAILACYRVVLAWISAASLPIQFFDNTPFWKTWICSLFPPM